MFSKGVHNPESCYIIPWVKPSTLQPIGDSNHYSQFKFFKRNTVHHLPKYYGKLCELLRCLSKRILYNKIFFSRMGNIEVIHTELLSPDGR